MNIYCKLRPFQDLFCWDFGDCPDDVQRVVEILANILSGL